MDSCLFCKIIKGEVPSTKVYENEDVFAFRDIEPHAPTHILIVPKKHIDNLAHASLDDQALLGKLSLAAKSIAQEQGILGAFKLTTNSGAFAGQVVMHLHFHLLGGWEKKEDVKSELHQ